MYSLKGPVTRCSANLFQIPPVPRIRTVGDPSIGHNAVVHGATVEDDCLIGMGATVLNGAVIGAGSLVAAQALVPQGMVVPAGSLVAGVPAKVRRELSPEEQEGVTLNGTLYADLAQAHKDVHR